MHEVVRANDPLSEKHLLEFNYLLLKNTRDEPYGGKLRNIPVIINGSAHQPPAPELLQTMLANLLQNYHREIAIANEKPNEKSSENPNENPNNETSEVTKLNLIARLHAEFERVHPFVDGNGRTGRLLLNLELLKQGYPMVIILPEQREDYFQALREYDQGNPTSIQEFIKARVQERVQEILDLVFPEWKQAYPEFAKRKAEQARL